MGKVTSYGSSSELENLRRIAVLPLKVTREKEILIQLVMFLELTSRQLTFTKEFPLRTAPFNISLALRKL